MWILDFFFKYQGLKEGEHRVACVVLSPRICGHFVDSAARSWDQHQRQKNKANEMNTINADVCRDLMPFFVCHYKKNPVDKPAVSARHENKE